MKKCIKGKQKMQSLMVMGNSYGKMEQNMKEISSMELLKVQAESKDLIISNMMVNGNLIYRMEKEMNQFLRNIFTVENTLKV